MPVVKKLTLTLSDALDAAILAILADKPHLSYPLLVTEAIYAKYQDKPIPSAHSKGATSETQRLKEEVQLTALKQRKDTLLRKETAKRLSETEGVITFHGWAYKPKSRILTNPEGTRSYHGCEEHYIDHFVSPKVISTPQGQCTLPRGVEWHREFNTMNRYDGKELAQLVTPDRLYDMVEDGECDPDNDDLWIDM